MTAEAFIITELTGPKREVRLFDRALPYKKFAAPRSQRHQKREYPGSRVATIQVLGPSLGDWSIEGIWKTRYIAARHSVELKGFGDIDNTGGRITAEDLVRVFKRLNDAGQTVEVRWGPEVRVGIVKDFTPEYDRVEDVAWKLEFVWSKDEDVPPRRAAITMDSTAEIQRVLDALDLKSAEMPKEIPPAQASDLLAKTEAVRTSGATLTDSLAKVQSGVTSPEASRAVGTSGDQVVSDAEVLRSGLLSDRPVTSLIPVDDVQVTLSVEVWRRDMAAAARDVQAQARQAVQSVSQRIQPGNIAVVTVTENTSLRTLALRYYGTADSWPIIADANHLVGSIAPAGLRVVIPRQAGQGAVAQ